MIALFDRFVLAGSVKKPPFPEESTSEPIGDSFILDWSLDGTESDDSAIDLTTSAK